MALSGGDYTKDLQTTITGTGVELAGARPEETIYVGDSIYDALCAQAAGVDFADAVWGSHTVDRPARYFPETPLEFLGMMK